jgi:acetylornithine deacetylase/succinyl-diaminopimelate desuccinylase-like protein
MDTQKLSAFCNHLWDQSALPELIRYIRIPNKSPAFDTDWQAHGHMDRVVAQFTAWCQAQALPGLKLEVVRLPGRTPLIYMETPGDGDDTVLLYGHLDKQPEMTGWRAGLGPWEPVLEGDRLYGRGGADDGYATFSSLIALLALKDQNVPRHRCVVIIEACEESGSFDLPFYIDALADRIGKPSLVICLDSGCGNYQQLWCTTSLRGLVGGKLTVDVLTEGVHSGDASGIVPSSFRILRRLLDRIDDPATGVVQPAFNVPIPGQRQEQARRAADVLGNAVYERFPFAGGTQPVSKDLAELILNRTWRPALSITGVEGVPTVANAGNVQRPSSTLKISLRLPPTCNAADAAKKLKGILESDPPYGANVKFEYDWAGQGWHAPPMVPWLEAAVDAASKNHFDGKPAMHMGEGGTIPFMGMLGEKFPEAQFLITGVLGPGANAHGPNEFLHIPTAKRLTACVAEVIAKHFTQSAMH